MGDTKKERLPHFGGQPLHKIYVKKKSIRVP